MMENTSMNIKNRSSKITADWIFRCARERRHPVEGGRFGGWSPYMKDGKPAYVYNFLGLARYTIASPRRCHRSRHRHSRLRLRRRRCRQGRQGELLVNGKPVAEGRVEKTQPQIFSADETATSASTTRCRRSGNRHRRGHAIVRPDQQSHA